MTRPILMREPTKGDVNDDDRLTAILLGFYHQLKQLSGDRTAAGLLQAYTTVKDTLGNEMAKRFILKFGTWILVTDVAGETFVTLPLLTPGAVTYGGGANGGPTEDPTRFFYRISGNHSRLTIGTDKVLSNPAGIGTAVHVYSADANQVAQLRVQGNASAGITGQSQIQLWSGPLLGAEWKVAQLAIEGDATPMRGYLNLSSNIGTGSTTVENGAQVGGGGLRVYGPLFVDALKIDHGVYGDVRNKHWLRIGGTNGDPTGAIMISGAIISYAGGFVGATDLQAYINIDRAGFSPLGWGATAYRESASNTTLLRSDRMLVMDTSGGPLTVILPNPATDFVNVPIGRPFKIKNRGSNIVTLDCSRPGPAYFWGETGAASYNLAAGNVIEIFHNGAAGAEWLGAGVAPAS